MFNVSKQTQACFIVSIRKISWELEPSRPMDMVNVRDSMPTARDDVLAIHFKAKDEIRIQRLR